MMGSLQLAKKEFGLAVDYLEKAVEAAPGFASAVIELSSARHQMGSSMIAASGLRFFLDANPWNAQVWQAVANLLFEIGELEEGQNAAQKSVEFDPFYDDTRLAINSLIAGNPRDAEDLFRKFLKGDGNHIHALVGLASLSVPSQQLLCNFSGYLQFDDYAGHNGILKQPDIISVGCWAHVRRKFINAKKALQKPFVDPPILV
jgi:tetratricopeptide (TPR) repeat protein